MAETTKAMTMLEIVVDPEAPGSAFSIPVQVKKLRSPQDVELDTASPDGNVVRQVYLDSVTGEQVSRDTLQKGIFESKPKKSDKQTWSGFKAISEDDLDTIAAATALDTFAVQHFIPLAQVPMERVTDAYFLAPIDGMTAKPLALLAAALKRRKAAGVFKFVKSTRQHLAVVYEKDGGLIVNTLAFSAEFSAVREAAEALSAQPVKISPAERSMAEQLVEALTVTDGVDVLLDSFEDDLVPLKADLVERALAGKQLPKRKQSEPAVPVGDDLEERLRRMVKDSSAAKGAPVTA